MAGPLAWVSGSLKMYFSTRIRVAITFTVVEGISLIRTVSLSGLLWIESQGNGMNLFDSDPYCNSVLQFRTAIPYSNPVLHVGSETCQGYQQNRAPKARRYPSPGHRPGFRMPIESWQG